MKFTLHHSTRKQIKKAMDEARITGNLRWFERLQLLLFLEWHPCIESACDIIRRCPRTLKNWLKLFMLKGYKGLKPKVPTGRRPRLTPAQKQQLKQLIIAGPEAQGFECGIWTSAMVQELIFDRFGVEYSVGYIPELLKSLNLSHKKVIAKSHKADPQAQRQWKEETFPELVKKADREGATILFEDESTFRLWSRVSYSWGEKGKELEADVFMSSYFRKAFGAIELTTGRFIFSQTQSLKALHFLSYLKYLLTRFNQKIYLVVDNGTSHRGVKVQQWLDRNHDKIELVRLPKYSPRLNPIETLWREIKKHHLNNRYFPDKEHFLKALLKSLRFYQEHPERVLSLLTDVQERAEQALVS